MGLAAIALFILHPFCASVKVVNKPVTPFSLASYKFKTKLTVNKFQQAAFCSNMIQ